MAEKAKPDLIFSWYLLPYCVAGHIVSRLIDKKHIIHHAGSDLTRLFNDPYLNNLLKEIIVNSDAVLTYSRFKNFFLDLGCKNIFINSPAFSEEFNPYGEKLNLKNQFGLGINPEKTLLFLGKINRPKGIEYLVEAFSEINDNESNLIIAGGGDYRSELEMKILNNGIRNIHFTGILPPWKIPSLIRSVKSVIIPEHNFNVSIHRSRIPYESLLCGKIPVVSEAICYKYQSFSKYFIKIDPTNKCRFKSILEEIINDDSVNDKIIKDYLTIRNLIGDFDDYLSKTENIFKSLIYNI